MNGLERLIDIVEDHKGLVMTLDIILNVIETGEKPQEAAVPTFNDELVEYTVQNILTRLCAK